MIYNTVCNKCKGSGKTKQRIRAKLKSEPTSEISLKNCLKCSGSGIISTENQPVANIVEFPHVAIIGAGIGGIALAVACLHRGIPFTVYERDLGFNTRSQGYGLTLQQASKAIERFGIFNLQGIVSTKHIVHTPEGIIVAEWGMRKWIENPSKKTSKKTNIHIARQTLRQTLMNQLGETNCIKWNHKLLHFNENNKKQISLTFNVNGAIKTTFADIVVGADGIRSTVRNQIINKDKPLRYLGCMVILGICPLKVIHTNNRSLLDGATVFQTANGNERIYVMPYDDKSVMWQLSFPISEEKSKELSFNGAEALKNEACKRINWHNPIPQILTATPTNKITGYPVYDRTPLTTELFETTSAVTLIGDAAHPMSPFKGQGANQAMLDALSLAQAIYTNGNSSDNWQLNGIKNTILKQFEIEMIQRSTVKVTDSAVAAQLLHSEIVLHESNQPRGSVFKQM